MRLTRVGFFWCDKSRHSSIDRSWMTMGFFYHQMFDIIDRAYSGGDLENYASACQTLLTRFPVVLPSFETDKLKGKSRVRSNIRTIEAIEKDVAGHRAFPSYKRHPTAARQC